MTREGEGEKRPLIWQSCGKNSKNCDFSGVDDFVRVSGILTMLLKLGAKFSFLTEIDHLNGFAASSPVVPTPPPPFSLTI